jgi:hypothetical protein
MNRMHFLELVFAFTLLAPITSARAAEQANPPVDIKTIVQRGAQTQARLQHEALGWTTDFELGPAGTNIRVKQVQSGDNRAIDFTVIHDGKSDPLCHIIVRDGAWYVAQKTGTAKYRPYEAPMVFPNSYLLLAKSEDIFAKAEMLSAARFEKLDANVLKFRTPLTVDNRQQVQRTLDMLEQFKKQRPELIDAKFEGLIANARDTLDHGVAIEIDKDTGMVLASGAPGYRFRVTDLHWLPILPLGALPNELSQAVDHTKALLDSSSKDDLAMLSYAAGWAPGQQVPATEVVVLNIRTGDFRRVPYRLVGTGNGCFSKDRRSVFITGLVLGEDAVDGLFQVDLATGAYRRIAKSTLGGITLFPTLSPDGRMLVVVNKDDMHGDSNWQVTLIEIATGRIRKVGPPRQVASALWLPDTSGLLVVTYKTADPNKPPEETIARMDFNGNVTPIRPGALAFILEDQKKIFFRDQSDKTWKTCDLSGQNVAQFGDGLRDFVSPALSPDGKQVLMMQFAPTGPHPYIVDLKTGAATEIKVAPGFWTMPAWR